MARHENSTKNQAEYDHQPRCGHLPASVFTWFPGPNSEGQLWMVTAACLLAAIGGSTGAIAHYKSGDANLYVLSIGAALISFGSIVAYWLAMISYLYRI